MQMYCDTGVISMDVWCSSCWVQFRVGAEYAGHLCHEKNPMPMIARLKNGEKENKRKIRHNSDSPQDQVCHGTYSPPQRTISTKLTLSGRRIRYCLLTVKYFYPLNKYLSSCSGMFIKRKSMTIKTKAIWQRLECST